MSLPLYCTLCAHPLEVIWVDGEGANLGCSFGHKFYYSPAHLEKGDILVIGELSFQCANEGSYPRLVGTVLGHPVVTDESLPISKVILRNE